MFWVFFYFICRQQYYSCCILKLKSFQLNFFFTSELPSAWIHLSLSTLFQSGSRTFHVTFLNKINYNFFSFLSSARVFENVLIGELNQTIWLTEISRISHQDILPCTITDWRDHSFLFCSILVQKQMRSMDGHFRVICVWSDCRFSWNSSSVSVLNVAINCKYYGKSPLQVCARACVYLTELLLQYTDFIHKNPLFLMIFPQWLLLAFILLLKILGRKKKNKHT